MYIEKRRKHTRMEASHCHEHQSPSLLLFFVQHYHHSSRKAKERIGYALYVVRNPESSSSMHPSIPTFRR